MNSPLDSASLAQPKKYIEQVLGDSRACSCADHTPRSHCSNSESVEVMRSSLRHADQEVKGFEAENSVYSNGRFSRETAPVGELCIDSSKVESTMNTIAVKPRRKYGRKDVVDGLRSKISFPQRKNTNKSNSRRSTDMIL